MLLVIQTQNISLIVDKIIMSDTQLGKHLTLSIEGLKKSGIAIIAIIRMTTIYNSI